MDYGTYSSASAGVSALRRLEVVTNNLANVNTPGFKRQVLRQEGLPFDETLANQLESLDPTAKPDHDRFRGVSQFETFVDFSQGSINQTGQPLDVALSNPNDFFSVQTANGVRYTRAGNLTLSSTGELVFPDGTPISGDGGPITVGSGTTTIAPNGAVLSDGVEVGKLQVTRFTDPSVLVPEGSTHFSLKPGGTPGEAIEAEVIPGSLEMSNVNVVPNIVELISTNRAFDAYSRVARSIDEMNQGAINQLGRGR